MLPKLLPETNHLGRSIVDDVPTADDVGGFEALDDTHRDVWERAVEHLRVRSNDGHTIYAYGLARALLAEHPDADHEVVLPAILLHDTGWSRVPPEDVLAAIAPGGGRPDLVIRHEKEGAVIARQVLEELGRPATLVDRVVEIVDGHDSRRHALSIDDALVKDADKLWRLTPHGVDTVMDWFGLDRQQARRLIVSRVHGHLFTDAARTIATALDAIAAIDATPERTVLG